MGLVVGAGAIKGVLSDAQRKIQAESTASAEDDLSVQYQQLCQLLQAAIELELTTLPPYLTAYFSIKEGSNVDSANLIRSVFMEEMLHLCLAGNVLVSMGGQVRLGEENIPRYPLSLQFDGKDQVDRGFQVTLGKFSLTAMQTFRRIELPDYLLPQGLPELNCDAEQTVALPAYSIGDLYQDIIDRLVSLDRAFGDAGRELFSDDTSNQITETYFWRGGGKPIAVTDLASAKEALSVIIDQGEGSRRSLNDGDAVRFDQAPDLSHYFKFTEIYFQRRFQADDNPKLPPTGARFAIDFEAVYPVKSNAKQSDYADNSDLADLNRQFNQSYSLMLRQIEEAFAGNPKVLYQAIMNGMHDLTPIARTMAKIEIDPAHSDESGAPSFEWVQPLTTVTTAASI